MMTDRPISGGRRTGYRLRWKIALACCSLLLAVPLLELAFRLPPIVTWTGGGTPALEAFKSRYDRLWDEHPDGFRTRYRPTKKPENVYRIVCLGDSYTWGDKIADSEDLWTSRLEQLLNAQSTSSKTKFEVVNLGRFGLTTFNEMHALSIHGYAYDPDLVVIAFTPNDALPSHKKLQSADGSFVFEPRGTLLPPPLHDRLDRSSHLYSFLNAKLNPYRFRPEYPQGYFDLYDDDMPGWKQCRDALGQIARMNASRDISTVLMLFDYRLDQPGIEEIFAKVSRESESIGIPTVNLLPVYAETGRPTAHWRSFPHDDHPNESGHALAAETLAAFLRDNHLLPDTP